MLSNADLLAKFRFDTAENEPAKNLQNFRKMRFSKMHFQKMHSAADLVRADEDDDGVRAARAGVAHRWPDPLKPTNAPFGTL